MLFSTSKGDLLRKRVPKKSNSNTYFISNKEKGRISKWVLQENKACQIFQKSEHFLPPDTYTHVSGGKKRSFFRKFDVLCFPVNTRFEILSFALLSTVCCHSDKKRFYIVHLRHMTDRVYAITG